MSELDDMLNAAGAPPRTVNANPELNIEADAEGNPVTPDELSRRKTASTEKPATDTSTTKTEKRESTAKSAKQNTPMPRADRFLWAVYALLCIISVIELYSASSREINGNNVFAPLLRHLMMLGMGVAICVGVSRMKLKYFVSLTPIFVFLSVMAMIYVLINGQVINGARRSFSLVGIQIQPAELLKISSVLIIAYVMSRNQKKGGGVTNRALIISVLMVGLFSALLFSQGLTNTLLLMGISVSMMVVGCVDMKKLLIVGAVFAVCGGAVLFNKMHESGDNTSLVAETGKDAQGNAATINRGGTWKNRMDRFNSDIPPYEQPITAENRQEMYSYMAQANGGLTGVLPGNSRETARLPLAFSDYIYAIVVEDWGFVGGIALIIIYLSLLGRAAAISLKCDRAFPAMLIMGMAVMIVLQALFHMAIVTGVFPVSGQPLPMISKGGTSMLVTSLAFGIMLSISRYGEATKNKLQKTTTELPKNIDAVNPLSTGK